MRQSVIHLAGIFLLFSTAAQAQQCLHDNNETQPQKQRRIDAVNAVRRINTAEAWNKSDVNKFVPFTELVTSASWKKLNGEDGLKLSDGAIGILPGFELHLSTDGTGYSMSLTDKSDPCMFTVYSNDVGIVFTGYPIDYLVIPGK